MNPCTTVTVCVCCGQKFDAYRPQSLQYPGNCALCIYEATFAIKPDDKPMHPQGRWTTKETPMLTVDRCSVHITLTPAQARSLLGHAEKQVTVLKERIKFGEEHPGTEPMAHLLEEYSHWSGFAGDLKDEMMEDHKR